MGRGFFFAAGGGGGEGTGACFIPPGQYIVYIYVCDMYRSMSVVPGKIYQYATGIWEVVQYVVRRVRITAVVDLL